MVRRKADKILESEPSSKRTKASNTLETQTELEVRNENTRHVHDTDEVNFPKDLEAFKKKPLVLDTSPSTQPAGTTNLFITDILRSLRIKVVKADDSKIMERFPASLKGLRKLWGKKKQDTTASKEAGEEDSDKETQSENETKESSSVKEKELENELKNKFYGPSIKFLESFLPFSFKKEKKISNIISAIGKFRRPMFPDLPVLKFEGFGNISVGEIKPSKIVTLLPELEKGVVSFDKEVGDSLPKNKALLRQICCYQIGGRCPLAILADNKDFLFFKAISMEKEDGITTLNMEYYHLKLADENNTQKLSIRPTFETLIAELLAMGSKDYKAFVQELFGDTTKWAKDTYIDIIIGETLIQERYKKFKEESY